MQHVYLPKCANFKNMQTIEARKHTGHANFKSTQISEITKACKHAATSTRKTRKLQKRAKHISTQITQSMWTRTKRIADSKSINQLTKI